ncbi:hypothetical protein ACFWA5_20530 [Streptomyces mirabilis]
MVKQLHEDTEARPGRQAGAPSPHRALATLIVRRHPLPTAEARTPW